MLPFALALAAGTVMVLWALWIRKKGW